MFRFLPTHWWKPSAWKTWGSYVHWRLETFGIYYPEGKWNWKAFTTLLKQMPSYRRWLSDFDELRRLSRLAKKGTVDRSGLLSH